MSGIHPEPTGNETPDAPSPSQQQPQNVFVEWYERFVAYAQQRPWLVAFLLLTIAIAGLSMIGISALAGSGSPPADEPTAQIAPTEGGPGTLVVATGDGWQPGDTIFLRLENPATDPPQQHSLAYATVAEDGSFSAPFLFPSDPPWIDLPRVPVVIQSLAAGEQVIVVFRVATAATPTANPNTPTPIPTPTPTLTPTLTSAPTLEPTITPTPVTGWRGEYYSNRDLTGQPTMVRTDAAVNFDWSNGAPSTGMPADGFSARWTRTLPFSAGTYRFYVRSDDGVRVWLDDEMILDEWHAGTPATHVAARTLTEGSHALRVEYYEHTGAASLRLWWEREGDFPQWRGEYFPNPDLIGASVLVRNDPTITFDWGQYAPEDGLPADEFSIRWTRYQRFEEGLYRFHALVDDGMRLYVDDVLVLNAWEDGARRKVTAERSMSAGNHSLRVEYYERTGDALIQVWWEQPASYPDWQGEYWSNRGLDGRPILVRNDEAIDFSWGWGAPAPDLPADNFSARWTRLVEFDAATYRFYTAMDDGVRLWVDDQLLIDDWRDGGPGEQTANLGLTQGKHTLRVEFYEHLGTAQARLWWEKVTNPTYPDWKGEYWSNANLSGDPALVRNDEAINFQWKGGRASVGLPEDGFSARWSRSVDFEAGVYRFYAQADDGVRLHVSGNLVLDEWHVSNGEQVYSVDLALTGSHPLQVTYYEQSGNALVKVWWERIGAWPTDTPPPTDTATPIPPSATPTPPTPTREVTIEPTPPPTLEPTTSPTITATPGPTMEPTPKPTATPTPLVTIVTLEPLPTFTPIATRTGVRINEVMAVTTDTEEAALYMQDEWIELYNAGPDAVELGEWLLDDGVDDSPPYQIPAGTVLQPGTFAIFFGQQTGLNLDDAGDEVRLLTPGGTMTDSVTFGPLAPNSSLSRDETGEWHTDWPPSPGQPNQPPAGEQMETGPVVLLEAQDEQDEQDERDVQEKRISTKHKSLPQK